MVTVLGERVRRPSRRDALLAVLGAAAVVAGTVEAAAGQVRSISLDALGVVLLVAATVAAVGWRRAAPIPALAVTTVLVNAYVLAGYPYGPVLLCLVVAVFEVARQRPLATSALACGTAAVISSATIFARVVDEHHATALLALAWTAWSALPWSLGALIHVVHAARRRSDRELMARAALQERMRVAGDVHDIAGHGFALIAMQAQVALLVFDEEPDQARRSLEAVRDTGATALADLRRMLDAFHPRAGGAATDGSDVQHVQHAAEPSGVVGRAAARSAEPAGITGLAELIEQVRAAGLPVEVTVGSDCEVPGPLAATMYRVVQEALTNVLRHAGPTHARILIERREGEMVLQVTDQGGGVPAGRQPRGRGLANMRRRVEAAHGRLDAGPQDGGGFRVHVRLPVPAASEVVS